MLQPAAVLCLALNVYFEARNEPPQGQMAVAQVTMRRARYDEDWVCPTVFAAKQFSWTAKYVRTRPRPRDPDAWLQAQAVARQAILWGYIRHWPDYSRGATHYHAVEVSPGWARRMTEVARIGRHIFYAPQD